MQTTELFRNENVSVELIDSVDKPYIAWHDLTDKYNDFKGFTQNVRGLKRAVLFIKQLANDERLKYNLTMGDITNILDRAKLKPHTYCGMD